MPLPSELSLNLVDTLDDVHRFWSWLTEEDHGGWLGCDTETGGLDWHRHPLRMVQFGDARSGWAIPWEKWPGLVEEVFRTRPEDYIFHNSKFDIHMLEHNGIKVPRHQVHDTLLLARVIHPHLPAGLKPVSDRLVDRRASAMQRSLDAIMMKHRWTWETIPWRVQEYWVYAALDPVLTWRIADALWRHDDYDPSLRRAYDVDLAVSMVVLDMERRGLMIDSDYCAAWSAVLRDYESRTGVWAKETYGVENIGSDRELIRFFQEQGVHLHRRTEKGQLSMDKETLKEIQHPLAPVVLSYRKANKRRTTYFDAWLEHVASDGRIHSSFNISGATTARMSSERPNLQNVPRSRMVRRGLIPRDGHRLVLADYDQIELRLMAHFANSKAMIQAIHSGEDLHSYTAKLVYRTDAPTKEQRRIAKSANFAKIYGAGLAKFALTAGVTVEDAQSFLEGYDYAFPEVKAFHQWVANEAAQSASRSSDKLAHLRSEFLGRQQVADPKEAYKLVNYLIQGTAADVLKMRMIDIDHAGLSRYLVAPIHDELAFEVPEDEIEEFTHELPKVMEDHESFQVPLSAGVEVVTDWGEKYEEGT